MLVAVPLALGLFWASRRWFERLPWLLGASVALPTTAVVSAGGQSLSAFQIVSMLLLATAWVAWTRPDDRGPIGWPGSLLLVGFVVWAVFVTLAGPTLFDGVPVLSSQGGIDEEVLSPSALGYTSSNVAQAGYLVFGAVVICFLAGRDRLSPHLLAPGLGAAMLFSNWRLAADQIGVPYPAALIDNSTNFKYIDSTATGDYRLRGVFPEPSGLALYSLTAAALALAMVPRTRGWVRVMYLGIAASAVLNLAYSGSGTALVGGGAVAGLALAIIVVRSVRGGLPLMPVAIAGCFGVVVLLLNWSRVYGYVAGQVGDKVDSTSYAARTTADQVSLELTLRTFGFGVGLGSNRPSSFWPMLLSCTGVIGTLLFLALVVVLIRRAWIDPESRVYFWLLLTVLTSKSVAGSALNEPLLQLALGGAAWIAWRSARGEPSPPSPTAPSAPPKAGARPYPSVSPREPAPAT